MLSAPWSVVQSCTRLSVAFTRLETSIFDVLSLHADGNFFDL